MLFGSNPELRAIIEYYGQDDCALQFQEDFAAAFSKVMNLDQTHYNIDALPSSDKALERVASDV